MSFLLDVLKKWLNLFASAVVILIQRCLGCYDSELEAFKKSLNVEVDFEGSEETCTTNPGHKNFIPITELKASHFPVKYRNQDLLKTVKSLGDLTVKISVSVLGRVKTGTGKIFCVTKNTSNCKNSRNPRQTWWEIEVLTSTHVVKTDDEARNSKCRLFYDTENSSLVSVEGLTVIQSLNSDNCSLICVTCDEELANRLNQLVNNFIVLYERTFDRFWNPKKKHKPVIIVSHPHGASKKVSIGKSGKTIKVSNNYSALTYTIDTCPGSTGAYVYTL
ncbi:uncharacterized protein LOC106074833 [Biomphalaria glabrata]|uniref:Uncharacterized protein LOC106074833 n=1 Tax=Biomphalaria glabrata TaxID=6526 RepID=A0A9W3ATB3_BIOGL|nr:uncharacterized protein LOC106074833 [Biomphalaria glabrata]